MVFGSAHRGADQDGFVRRTLPNGFVQARTRASFAAVPTLERWAGGDELVAATVHPRVVPMTKLMEDGRGLRALLEEGAHVLPDLRAVRTGFCPVGWRGGRETFPRVRPLLGLVICAERSRLLRRCTERWGRDDCGVRFQCFVLLPGRASRRPRATGSNVTSEARPAAIERWRGGAPVGIGRRVRRGVQPTAGGRRVAPCFRAAAAGEPPHWKRWTQGCLGPSCEGASGGAVVCIEPRLEGLQEAGKRLCARTEQRFREHMRTSARCVCSGSTPS